MVVAIDRRQNSHRMLPRKCDIRLKRSRIAATRRRLSKVAGDLRKYSTTFEDWGQPSTFGFDSRKQPSIFNPRITTVDLQSQKNDRRRPRSPAYDFRERPLMMGRRSLILETRVEILNTSSPHRRLSSVDPEQRERRFEREAAKLIK